MSKCYYNEVLLPEIPSDALAEYPYYVIIRINYKGQTMYMLSASPVPLFYGLIVSTYYGLLPTDTSDTSKVCSTYQIDENSGAYILGDTQSCTEYSCAIGAISESNISELIWTNTDIPNGSADATDIYMYASEPIPYEEKMYITKESTLTALAEQARRLNGGSTDLLTVQEMITIFEAVDLSSGGSDLPSVEGVMF